MLTRLKVSGFKNLIDVDVRFGPFTCIAGINGVGKSNLFDAIQFISALADNTLIDAALSVRSDAGRTADIQSLFNRSGDKCAPVMSFEAEMIVPATGEDDLGQTAKASITFLRYSLKLGYRQIEYLGSMGSLELLEEKLVHITRGQARAYLPFPHARKWRESAVTGKRTGGPFISTVGEAGSRIIQRHQDGGSRGRPLSQAANLPRTVLSVANAAESPTALLARREMQSWRLMQLEPSALRKPDEFSASPTLGSDGSHLAANLYRLARRENMGRANISMSDDSNCAVYAQVANRLAELIDDVRELHVDRDETRELLTLFVTGRDKTAHAARALSDGTLRFLALAVLAEDPQAQGVMCLEEPENGLHPERIPAMLELLQDIVTDVEEPMDTDNPLRQVIINTHSPSVVQQVPDGSLLVAEQREVLVDGQRHKGVSFSCLPDTWRIKKAAEEDRIQVCVKGRLLAYLNPVTLQSAYAEANGHGAHSPKGNRKPNHQRVIDRKDMQMLLPFTRETK